MPSAADELCAINNARRLRIIPERLPRNDQSASAFSSWLLVFHTKMCEMLAAGGMRMKREALIRELRKLARKQGKHFEVIEDKGKGSHCRLEFGDKAITVKSGELRPGYVALIKRQLGID